MINLSREHLTLESRNYDDVHIPRFKCIPSDGLPAIQMLYTHPFSAVRPSYSKVFSCSLESQRATTEKGSVPALCS